MFPEPFSLVLVRHDHIVGHCCYRVTECHFPGPAFFLSFFLHFSVLLGGRSTKLVCSYVTWFVHVGEKPCDGHVSNRLPKEHFFNCGRADWTQRRQEQQQLPEAARLSRVPRTKRRSGDQWTQKKKKGTPNISTLLSFVAVQNIRWYFLWSLHRSYTIAPLNAWLWLVRRRWFIFYNSTDS